MIHTFPKDENTQTISFQRSCSHVSFSGQGLYCVNFHRPTSQEFTPTSNITLLILCSRQAIVSLCRPGGVRAARFNPPPPSVGVQGVSDYVCIKTKFFPKSCAKFLEPPLWASETFAFCSIKFWHNFWHAFFSISAPILSQFWSIFPDLCIPFSSIEFSSIFYGSSIEFWYP